jgi:polysaccharide biosynthesis transport protein
MDFQKLVDGNSSVVGPVSQSPANVAALLALPPQEPTLGDYWRILLKRRLTVIACVAVVATVATVYSLKMTPIYEGVARINILHQVQNFLNFRDAPEFSASDESDDQAAIATQVKVLQTDSLALQVIRKLQLDQRPAFGAGPVKTNDGGLTISGSSSTERAREDDLIKIFHSNLKVEPVPGTSLIEVRYASPDPNLAAEVTNTVATTFIEQNIKAKFDSTMQAAEWLSKQLADLQIKVESSQAKLVEYQKEHGIVGADDKQNLTVEKLNELGQEVTHAQSDRIQKEALYQVTKDGSADTVSQAMSDQLLQNLRQQDADLRSQYAEALTMSGPSYPKALEIKNRLDEVDRSLESELKKSADRIANDYNAAVARERLLQAALASQKAENDRLSENAIEYKVLKQEADSNRQLYDSLLQKLKEASLAAGLASTNMRVVDNARVPRSPARPNIPRNIAFGFLIGLIGGVALAFALEALDNTVRTPDQAEAVAALPTLAVIPLQSSLGRISQRKLLESAHGSTRRPGTLISLLEPKSEMTEAYRALRTAILLSSLGEPPKTILVTSALPQDGKTMTSVNTAIVFAQLGKRVLLVDADLRRPSLHRVFGLRPAAGLSNGLTGSGPVEDFIVPTEQPNLHLLPAGPLPPHPAELIGSSLMRELIEGWKKQYDHVILDSPPALSVTDGVLLAAQVERVLLVVRSGQTTNTALRRLRDLMLQVKAKPIGLVVNCVDLNSPDYYYYYYSGSKYGGYYADADAPRLKGNGNGHGA